MMKLLKLNSKKYKVNKYDLCKSIENELLSLKWLTHIKKLSLIKNKKINKEDLKHIYKDDFSN